MTKHPAEPPEPGPLKWFNFPRRDPTREGPLMGAARAAWNLVLSSVLGIAIGGFGSQIIHEAGARLFGPLGETAAKLIAAGGWVVGCATAFVCFMSYYLDDSGE